MHTNKKYIKKLITNNNTAKHNRYINNEIGQAYRERVFNFVTFVSDKCLEDNFQ